MLALPVLGELPAEEWRRVRKEAARLATRKGEADRKLDLIHAVSKEDSARAARLLLGVAAASAKRRETLAPRVEKAKSAFMKLSRRVRKKYGRHATNETLEKDSRWRASRDAFHGLRADLEAEEVVLAALGDALARVRSRHAIAVLVDRSEREVARAYRSVEVRTGILRALFGQPVAAVAEHLVFFATDAGMPEGSARALRRIGDRRIRDGYDAAVVSLQAPESAVGRAAVSDGAPAVAGGNALPQGPPLRKAVRDFLDANRAFGCIVHTIGVGPDHNRAPMQRLARETGGTYKAVGVR